MLIWSLFLVLALVVSSLLVVFILRNEYAPKLRKQSSENNCHAFSEQFPENNNSVSASISSSCVEHPRLYVRNIDTWERYHSYKVKGKNPETNRLKTCTVLAKEGTPENEIALKSGFNPPFTVELDNSSFYERLPSEKQLDYAKDLNISIPANCTSCDISCLISKQKGETTNDWISHELYDFLSENECLVSPYESILGGVCVAINALEQRDSYAFFAYLVYCITNNLEIGNFHNSQYENIFYDFSDLCVDNFQISDAYVFEIDQIKHLLEKKRFDGRNKKKAFLFDFVFNFLSAHI